MRRVMAGLLALLLMPVCALAAPDTPYAPETVLQTAPLSDGALAALDVLYPAIRRCEAQIELPGGTLYEDASAAMRCLSRNYPELFHLENEWTIGYYQAAPAYATMVKPAYAMTAWEYEATLTRLLEAARSMTASVSGAQTDDAEILHDLLCEAASYDRSETLDADNTAVGALLMGVTRCEGYAQALSLLYRLAGISCGVVAGEVGVAPDITRHAWNAAVIDGMPTLIDATWNDQEENGCVTHWYYGLMDAMMAADHVPDPEFSLPVMNGIAVNWHARRGLLVTDSAGLYAAIRRFALEGEVSIRFADPALYDDLIDRTNDWLREYNATCGPGETFYGSYGMIFSDEQHCAMLRRTEETSP